MSEPAAAPRGLAWGRLPFLVLGFVALAAGVGAGLARLGWPMPAVAADAAALHGPLMVCGFFGVVISLERAVALGRAWAYAAPLGAGLGTAAAMHGAATATPWLYTAGALGLFAASAAVLRRQREGFTLVIALAAACWAVGTLRWALGAPVHAVLPWWVAFLVGTIAGERLELSRFMPPSRSAQRLFGVIAALAGLALLLPLAWAASSAWAERPFGAALVALAAWLLRNDIARRTVRQAGLTRFIAVCLLCGYAWLAVGGAVMAAAGLAPGGGAYDVATHALLLGFVFSMVFGHAAIIFPAVLRVAVRYHPIFYLPLALLHASVALRVAGSAAGSFAARQWGAMGSALALAAFIVVMVLAVRRGRPGRQAAG